MGFSGGGGGSSLPISAGGDSSIIRQSASIVRIGDVAGNYGVFLGSNPGGDSGLSFDSGGFNVNGGGIYRQGANMHMTPQSGGIIDVDSSSVDITSAGQGLRVAEGTNAKQGLSSAMVAGAVTVSNTSVTATSRIVVTRAPGGTNPGAVYVSAISAGVSFTITSTNAADTGQVFYQIFEVG